MPQTEFVIPGKAAAITASGSGIGLQIAKSLAAISVDVVINDIDESALEEATRELEDASGRVVPVVGDASQPEDMERLIETTVDRFGGLDILVNNVGIAGPTKPAEEISPEEFLRTLEVNLGGHFNAVRAAIPHLREGDDGRIVCISSMSGKRPLRDRTPYTTSKMGVIGFVRTLAIELAADDITVNAICPGSVEGPRIERVIEGQAESQGRSYEDVRQEFEAVSPMEELIQSTDIADTVLYLCSEQASHVTGQDLNVTAGACMY